VRAQDNCKAVHYDDKDECGATPRGLLDWKWCL